MTPKNIILIITSIALVLTLGLFFLGLWIWHESGAAIREGTAVAPQAEIRNKLEPEKMGTTIIAVGDIMLSRTVEQKMIGYKDFNYPFLKTASYLKRADLAFGNLETAITPGRIIQTGEMAFRADPQVAKILSDNNFKILSLANNHTPNFGNKGLADTFKYLGEAGIKYIGAGENQERALAPQYTETNGVKIAWLARTEQLMVPENYAAGEEKPGTAFWDKKEVITAVKKAREQADLVFVSMHAGVEYTPEPNKQQIDFAKSAIEAGAEIVIGHHPHVVQTAEKYQGKYIFYSLGNFIFDQMWSRETREGIILKLALDKAGINRIEVAPILIEDFCQPAILIGEEGEQTIKRLGLEFEKNDGGEYILK